MPHIHRFDLAGVCTGDGPCETTPTGTGRNWVTKAGGLPPYVRALVNAFKRGGVPEQQAVQRAIGVLHNWAAGKGNVTAATRARAAKALAEWDALRAKARTTHDHSRGAAMSVELTREQRQRRLELAVTAAKRRKALTYPGTSKFPIMSQQDFDNAWRLRGHSTIPKAKVEAWLRKVATAKGFTIPGGGS